MDYNGVAHHPAQALEADAADDVDGALTSLDDEVPRLAAAHAAVRGHFAGIGDLGGVAAEDTCVEALADERLRAKFEAALTAFTRSMEIVLPSEKGLPYVAGRQGVRHDRAAGLPPLPRPHAVRRPDLRPEGVGADRRARAVARISQRIHPISITSADYAEKVRG